MATHIFLEFSPRFVGEDEPILTSIFLKNGWLNHQVAWFPRGRFKTLLSAGKDMAHHMGIFCDFRGLVDVFWGKSSYQMGPYQLYMGCNIPVSKICFTE